MTDGISPSELLIYNDLTKNTSNSNKELAGECRFFLITQINRKINRKIKFFIHLWGKNANYGAENVPENLSLHSKTTPVSEVGGCHPVFRV